MFLLNTRIIVLFFVAAFAALSACSDDTDEQSAALCCDEPVALIDAPGFRGHVYVDSNEIYWLDGGILKKTSKERNDPKLVAETNFGSTHLLGDDEFLYAIGEGFSGAAVVTRMKRDGSGQKKLGTGEEGEYLCDVVADENHVYWSDESSVYSIAKDGSSLHPFFLTAKGGCVDIAVGETYVFFADNTGIYRIDKVRGGEALPVVSFDLNDETSIYKLILQGDTLYWAQSNDFGPGEVKRISIHGEDEQTLASGQSDLFDLAVDNTHVYWTTYESGRVRRVPQNGGTIEDIRVAQTHVPLVYLDKNYVYWVEGERLMKRIK